MALIIILLILIAIIRTIVFLRISKLNGSYFHSDTANFAMFLLIKYIPLMLTIKSYDSRIEAVYLFALILAVGTITSYFGYVLGRKINICGLSLPAQNTSIIRYKNYLVMSMIGMIAAFLILAHRSLGLYQWIFNNRVAYIMGRAGNGIWYILFELFLIVSATLILCIADMKKNKKVLFWYAIIFVSAYFTGSKGMILSLGILFLINYDLYFKKISRKHLIILGCLGLLAVVALLWFQSGVSLLQYADYYKQFINFLDFRINNDWSYMHGQIAWEEFFWKLIPRQFYPDKPYIYGQIRLVNIFFDKASIEAGNTPSLSEFIVPYADFGVFGVGLNFLWGGIVQGFFEKQLRTNLSQKGGNFNALFLYSLIFIAKPVNFSTIYIVVFMVILYFIQTIKIGFRVNIKPVNRR